MRLFPDLHSYAESWRKKILLLKVLFMYTGLHVHLPTVMLGIIHFVQFPRGKNLIRAEKRRNRCYYSAGKEQENFFPNVLCTMSTSSAEKNNIFLCAGFDKIWPPGLCRCNQLGYLAPKLAVEIAFERLIDNTCWNKLCIKRALRVTQNGMNLFICKTRGGHKNILCS